MPSTLLGAGDIKEPNPVPVVREVHVQAADYVSFSYTCTVLAKSIRKVLSTAIHPRYRQRNFRTNMKQFYYLFNKKTFVANF